MRERGTDAGGTDALRLVESVAGGSTNTDM